MATNWLGSAHEQVTTAYAQAPSFQKMATQMGIIDFHQWASAKAIDLHSRAGQQVKAEFGSEVFGMLDALSECMEKISKELKLKEAKFGLTMALPLVGMQHNTLKPPATEGPMTDAALLDEAVYWVDFAQGAYGKDDIKGYDKASVNVAIGEKPGVEVKAANLQTTGVQLPGHFVAVDRTMKAVVLGIRGTTTLSDALTDAVGEATEVEKCPGLLAHKAMLASAKAVIENTRSALEQALKETGFPLLITGHSLGAGTAILCTVLLSVVSPLSGRPRMRCFAFAPPPVVGPLTHNALRGLTIHSFINRADVVPRASLANVFHLGLECMAVDRLDLYHHRFNLMRRDAAPENEEETKAKQLILDAVQECQDERAKKHHESFPPLFVAGQVYWIEWQGQVGSVEEREVHSETKRSKSSFFVVSQDVKTDSSERKPRVHMAKAEAFQALLLRGGTNALKDHMQQTQQHSLQKWPLSGYGFRCGGYKEGLEGYKAHLQAFGGCHCVIN
eukprot:symbB.v1.2.018098.t1/scaffold1432.1/size120878/2